MKEKTDCLCRQKLEEALENCSEESREEVLFELKKSVGIEFFK